MSCATIFHLNSATEDTFLLDHSEVHDLFCLGRLSSPKSFVVLANQQAQTPYGAAIVRSIHVTPLENFESTVQYNILQYMVKANYSFVASTDKNSLRYLAVGPFQFLA